MFGNNWKLKEDKKIIKLGSTTLNIFDSFPMGYCWSCLQYACNLELFSNSEKQGQQLYIEM